MEELYESYAEKLLPNMKGHPAHNVAMACVKKGFEECHALMESREKVLAEAIERFLISRQDADLIEALAAVESKQVDVNETHE